MKHFGKFSDIAGEVYEATLFAISRIIPLIVTGGLLIAFSSLIGTKLLGMDLSDSAEHLSYGAAGSLLYVLNQSGTLVLAFMLPLLSSYIAVNIAGKEAAVAGLIAGIISMGGISGIISVPESGYFGSICGGGAAGFLTLWMKRNADRESGRRNAPFYNTFLVPLLSSFLTILLMYYCLAPLFGLLIDWLYAGLLWLQDHHLRILVGGVTGAMSNFDFGGPVNKLAYNYSRVLFDAGNREYYAAFTAAKIIPGISVFLAAKLYPGLFTQNEREQALPAAFMSCFGGITEGAIPYALQDPVPVIFAEMAGGAAAAAMVMSMRIDIAVNAGGSLLSVFMVSDPWKWVGALMTGLAVTLLLLYILKRHFRKIGK